MAQLKIRIYGDPVLRKVAEPIEEITDEVRQLAEDMLETMYANDGIGLAANQVGVLKQLFVMDMQLEKDNPGPMVFINPVIRNPKGTEVMEEGCLSIPGIRGDVKRAREIDFEALTLDGEKVTLHADGLLARVMLHETDHLFGRLFVDYFSPVKKMMIRDELRALEREAAKLKVA